MKHFITFFTFLILFSFSSQAQWTDCNSGLYRGEMNCIDYKDNKIFAGTRGGVCISSDNGTKWIKSNLGLTNLNVLTIVNNGRFIYAGTDKGLFKSTNDGASWAPLYKEQLDTSVKAIAVSGDSVFASLLGWGVYLSTDNGNTFTDLKFKSVDFSVSFLFLRNGNLYAGSGISGLFVMPRNDTGWIRLISADSIRFYSSFSFKNDSIFAMTNKGVMLSTDECVSWQVLIDQVESEYIKRYLKSDSLFIASTNHGVYISKDYGKNWMKSKTAPKFNDISFFSLNKPSGIIFAGNVYALYYSSDLGETWIKIDQSLDHTTITSILAASDNGVLAYASDVGLFISDNNGDEWRQGYEYTGQNNIRCLAVKDNYIYGGSDYGYVFNSSDYGLTWSKNLLPGNNGNYPDVNCLLIDNDNLYAATKTGIFLSKSDSHNWNSLTDGKLNLVFSLAKIGDNLFAGVSWQTYHSPDNGASWHKEVLTGNDSKTKIHSIVSSGNIIYAANQQEIFYTCDNGNNWIKANPIDELPEISSIAVTGNEIFAGTDKGVFLTTDSGLSWKQINYGLTDLNIKNLSIYGNYLYAGTSANGVYRSEIDKFVSVTDLAGKVTGVGLFPNPVTDQITLKRNSFSEASITIINQIGQEVYRNFIQADADITTIPFSGYPAGLYFLRIHYYDGHSDILKFMKI